MNFSKQDIVDNTKEFLDCDDVEISQVGNTYFLFLCYNKRSVGEYFKSTNFNDQQEPMNFEYVERHVIASGKTLEELKESVDFYIKLTRTPNSLELLLEMFKRHGVKEDDVGYLKWLENFREGSLRLEQISSQLD